MGNPTIIPSLRVVGPQVDLDVYDVMVNGPRRTGELIEMEVIKPTSGNTLHVLGTVSMTEEDAERLALQLLAAATRRRDAIRQAALAHLSLDPDADRAQARELIRLGADPAMHEAMAAARHAEPSGS